MLADAETFVVTFEEGMEPCIYRKLPLEFNN
jgi:hypothetical protein